MTEESVLDDVELSAEEVPPVEGEANPDIEPETEGAQEVEIVLADDETSPAQPNSHFVAERFKRRLEKREARDAETNDELGRLRAENEQLKQGEIERPRRSDYVTDEEYDDAFELYQDQKLDRRLKASQISDREQAAKTQQATMLKDAMSKHYKRVQDLNVSNYDQCEEQLIDIFGEDRVRAAIYAAGEDSAKLVAYWGGTNPDAAKQFMYNIETDPYFNGNAFIGRLCEKLKTKPKQSTAPAPETPVDGGSVPSDQGWANRLKAAYDSTDPVNAYLRLAKEAEAKGINLRDYDTD